MNVLGATNKADTAHTETVSVNSLLCTSSDSWMIRQTKIVVSTEIQYSLATCNFDLSALRASDNSLNFVGACILNKLDSVLTNFPKLYNNCC